MNIFSKGRTVDGLGTAISRRARIWLGQGVLLSVIAAGGACGSSEESNADECAPGEGPQGGQAGGNGQSVSGSSFLPTSCDGDACTIAWPSVLLAQSDCPSGTNCGGGTNGLGIYVGRAGNYCFTAGGTEGTVWCPQAFINEAAARDFSFSSHSSVFTSRSSKVEMLYWRGGDSQQPYVVERATIGASLPGLDGADLPVHLERIDSTQTELSITYRDQSDALHTATVRELGSVKLWFSTKEFRADWLKVEPDETGGREITRYKVSAEAIENTQSPGPPSSFSLCRAGDGTPLPASFLGGRAIHGVSGEVTADANTTTLGCQTGAIDTCIDLDTKAGWRYAPWNPRATEPESGDFLFATCLQAKRAAYFVGHGDPGSFTTDGTELQLRDPFGIHADEIEGADALEAVWGPHGAVCLNVERARHPELLGDPKALTVEGRRVRESVPRCTSTDWASYRFGKLATSLRK